jgi:hypothetical protein
MSLSACPPRIASGSRSGRSSWASSIEGTRASGGFVSDIEDDWEGYQVDPLEFYDRGERVAVVGQVRAVGRGSVNIDSIAGFVLELRCGRIRHVTSHSNPEAARHAVSVRT